MCVQLAERNHNLEMAHQQLEQKVAALESKCDRYESSLAELQKTIQSLRQSKEQPRGAAAASGRVSWDDFSPTSQGSALYSQLPVAKPRKDKNESRP